MKRLLVWFKKKLWKTKENKHSNDSFTRLNQKLSIEKQSEKLNHINVLSILFLVIPVTFVPVIFYQNYYFKSLGFANYFYYFNFYDYYQTALELLFFVSVFLTALGFCIIFFLYFGSLLFNKFLYEKKHFNLPIVSLIVLVCFFLIFCSYAISRGEYKGTLAKRSCENGTPTIQAYSNKKKYNVFLVNSSYAFTCSLKKTAETIFIFKDPFKKIDETIFIFKDPFKKRVVFKVIPISEIDRIEINPQENKAG